MRTILITLVTYLTFFGAVSAQDLKASAQNHFSNQNWEAAIKDYKKYLKKNEGDSSDYYNLAFSSAKMKKYEEAIKYFKKAKDKNFPQGFIYYGTAKAYALLQDESNMLSMLKEGAENGLAAYGNLKKDTAFAPYTSSDQFQAVLKKVKLNAYPCLSNTDYRHFDFWLGEWDVYAGGGKVGVNKITMAEGGCAIHENYTTAGSYSGQSINFFDPVDQKWHQHWVGSASDTYNYVEIDRGEGMLQFQSKYINPQGKLALSKLTFTLNDDGTVRQLFEISTDEGKTWTPGFDGTYKKRG